jgi:hypothetical protein
MTTHRIVIAVLTTAAVAGAILLQITAGEAQKSQGPIGYTDTPMLPGGKWHVHDSGRPQPRAVDPGTCSTQDLPGKPPSDAAILFDGTGLSKWQTENGQPPAWIVTGGVLQVPPSDMPNGGDIYTRESFGDCQLHVEWATPDPPTGEVMNRGNSGVFFFGRYELQVFDSYRGGIYADGQAAAIYGQYPPLVNASRKPGDWQVFDVLFTAPRFKDGMLEAPAFITVFHNLVAVHNHVALLGATGHRILAKYTPHGPKGPLMLQAHGNPVRYRNIWVRPLKGYDEP